MLEDTNRDLLFAVGSHVATYEGLLNDDSFDRWERVLYQTFLAHLKSEMRSATLRFDADALAELANRTVKTAASEHYIDVKGVSTQQEFVIALGVLGSCDSCSWRP